MWEMLGGRCKVLMCVLPYDDHSGHDSLSRSLSPKGSKTQPHSPQSASVEQRGSVTQNFLLSLYWVISYEGK